MMAQDFTLEIESLDLDGRGVGHRDGKVVFVAGALPGERVRATPKKVKPSYETAELAEVLRASSLRVAPRCRHFGLAPGSCGGCAMQHVDPAAQVAIKQRALEDALWHIGRVRPECMLRPIHGPTWHYRYRARLSVRDVVKKGGVLVGFHERASSYVADMRECHVLPSEVGALLLPLRELVAQLSIRKRMPQIELAVADAAGQRRIVLVLRNLEPLTEQDGALLVGFGARHGVEFWQQPGGPQTAVPLAPAYGELTLALPEFNVALPFGPTDFTQVNHRINEVLVRRALRLLDVRPHERVADFFCGLGNFTLPLAMRGRQVTGIEGSEALVKRAQAAATGNGLQHKARFEARNLFAWTGADWDALNKDGLIDAVLIDPPREGAQAVAQALAGATQRPRRVVYVSCNPSTLARDCAILSHEGAWHLKAAGVVNMFPHTTHVESLAVLEPGPA
ncbi:MAG: 23S rRNA (uracil(1939)-C(5))-methyltransferase RlmD [Betaproteobacteria bacterium]